MSWFSQKHVSSGAAGRVSSLLKHTKDELKQETFSHLLIVPLKQPHSSHCVYVLLSLFMQWGQLREWKSACKCCLAQKQMPSFCCLFVTVAFCKWQCWVITCVKNQAGRGQLEKVEGGSEHQALIGHQTLAMWHHWGWGRSTVNKEGNAWMALCASEAHEHITSNTTTLPLPPSHLQLL